MVNKMFNKQIGRNMEVYVDDMLVKSKEELAHLDDLRETFTTLKQYQMKLNPSKCVFKVASDKFLGFMVSQRGIEANLEKVQAIINMVSPRTVFKSSPAGLQLLTSSSLEQYISASCSSKH